MDPAGVTQQRSLEQIRETLLQGEQALAEQREYIIQQKDPARQQEDIARYLRYMQRLELRSISPCNLGHHATTAIQVVADASSSNAIWS